MPYQGTSRAYNYEIWVKSEADAGWSLKSEDNARSFQAQGYARVLAGTTPLTVRSDCVLADSTPARYVAVRVTGGTGSTTLTATFHTINIYGWRLKSDYAVDEAGKTITVPAGVPRQTLSESFYVIGNGRLTADVNGDVLAVLDEQNAPRAEYRIRSIIAGLSGSDVTAEYYAYNDSASVMLETLLLLAEYDAGGRLIRLLSTSLGIDPKAVSKGSLVLTDCDPARVYRAFLWDRATYAPLAAFEVMG
jgi:hypothetical protein